MSSERRVLVHPTPAALASSVAARFITTISAVLAGRDEASVVLTGGSVGIAILAAINASSARDRIDWSRVSIWWGDERWLPRGHEDRNDRQAREALLDHVPLTPTLIHPFPASDELDDLDAAATVYAHELAEFAKEGEALPAFDLLFLGVGPDGHIASLFPERSGIRVANASVIPVRNSPKPPLERLSLTLPTINSATRIWLALAGADKASALGLALAGASVNEVPAAGACGLQETLFFVDQAAAAEVADNLISPE